MQAAPYKTQEGIFPFISAYEKAIDALTGRETEPDPELYWVNAAIAAAQYAAQLAVEEPRNVAAIEEWTEKAMEACKMALFYSVLQPGKEIENIQQIMEMVRRVLQPGSEALLAQGGKYDTLRQIYDALRGRGQYQLGAEDVLSFASESFPLINPRHMELEASVPNLSVLLQLAQTLMQYAANSKRYTQNLENRFVCCGLLIALQEKCADVPVFQRGNVSIMQLLAILQGRQEVAGPVAPEYVVALCKNLRQALLSKNAGPDSIQKAIGDLHVMLVENRVDLKAGILAMVYQYPDFVNAFDGAKIIYARKLKLLEEEPNGEVNAHCKALNQFVDGFIQEFYRDFTPAVLQAGPEAKEEERSAVASVASQLPLSAAGAQPFFSKPAAPRVIEHSQLWEEVQSFYRLAKNMDKAINNPGEGGAMGVQRIQLAKQYTALSKKEGGFCGVLSAYLEDNEMEALRGYMRCIQSHPRQTPTIKDICEQVLQAGLSFRR